MTIAHGNIYIYDTMPSKIANSDSSHFYFITLKLHFKLMAQKQLRITEDHVAIKAEEWQCTITATIS